MALVVQVVDDVVAVSSVVTDLPRSCIGVSIRSCLLLSVHWIRAAAVLVIRSLFIYLLHVLHVVKHLGNNLLVLRRVLFFPKEMMLFFKRQCTYLMIEVGSKMFA